MATGNFRFVVHHIDAGGNTLKHFSLEQFLMTVNTLSPDGRPDPADLKTRLTNNGKLRGTTVHVHSYVQLDPQYNSEPNILS